MFIHSVPVPRLYKTAAKVLKEVKITGCGYKDAIFRLKHHNIKAVYALVVEAIKYNNQIEKIIEMSQLLIKEPRFDSYLAQILIVELLWGNKLQNFTNNCKPIQVILSYRDEFVKFAANLEMFPELARESLLLVWWLDVYNNKMENEQSDAPLIPQHTRQAATAVGILLFYSFLMFTLPFGAYFGTNYLLSHYFNVEQYTKTVWSVIAAVVTVNLIICAYAYQAYHETEYDEYGNEIKHEDLTKED